MSKSNNNFLPQKGFYKDLIIYQKAECICDLTYHFCHRFLDQYKDRTLDQMVQAARSGKQNIVEGTAASATSKETEIKLLNVAKASHQELLEDYKDYLTHHDLKIWEKGEPRYEKLREVCSKHNDRKFYMKDIDKRSDEAIANICITLICQEDIMLHNYIERLKLRFLQAGGIKEEMTRGRVAYRQGQSQSSHHNATEEELTRLSNLLVQREQALVQREKELEARERALVQREKELEARERALAQREKELEAREQALLQREQEVARLLKMHDSGAD